MKCGLICARRARTSASISLLRDASSSASSSWEDTQPATSSVARTSPASADTVKTCSVPTTFSSTTRGVTTAERMAQAALGHGRSRRPTTKVAPSSTAREASPAVWSR